MKDSQLHNTTTITPENHTSTEVCTWTGSALHPPATSPPPLLPTSFPCFSLLPYSVFFISSCPFLRFSHSSSSFLAHPSLSLSCLSPSLYLYSLSLSLSLSSSRSGCNTWPLDWGGVAVVVSGGSGASPPPPTPTSCCDRALRETTAPTSHPLILPLRVGK